MTLDEAIEQIAELESTINEIETIIAPIALWASVYDNRDDIMTPVLQHGNQALCVGVFQDVRKYYFDRINRHMANVVKKERSNP